MVKNSKNTALSQSETYEAPESYEAASAELEKIVAAMETGQMSLEASLAAYQRGAELLHYCQNKLQAAQQQVKILEADMLKNFTRPDADDR